MAHLYGVSILGTMPGPCWVHVWPIFTSRPARVMKFSRQSQHGLRTMCMACFILETMSGPCWDHVWAKFTSQPKRDPEIFKAESMWFKTNVYGMSTFWEHFRAMCGSCWDHVSLSFTSRSARALKFARLSQHGLFYLCLECLLLRTMLGPCLA